MATAISLLGNLPINPLKFQGKSFRFKLTLISMFAFLVRLLYVIFVEKGDPLNGDAFYYHHASRLLVEEAFCVDVEGMLDHLLVAPVYFDTAKHAIDDYIDHIESSFRLLEPVLEQYPDVIVQLEGNADERGTLEYNKALSDRRWVTPSKVLLALYFDEDRTQGVGRSEQCPLPRIPGSSRDDWWSKNRRTDYIFKFGS